MKNPTIETKERRKKVLEKFRLGWSRKKICDWMMDEYNITNSMSYKYIHDAFSELCETAKTIDMEEIRNAQLERAESLLETAIETNDIKSAIKAQDMINKLNNLYVERQEIKAEIETWTFDYGE